MILRRRTRRVPLDQYNRMETLIAARAASSMYLRDALRVIESGAERYPRTRLRAIARRALDKADEIMEEV